MIQERGRYNWLYMVASCKTLTDWRPVGRAPAIAYPTSVAGSTKSCTDIESALACRSSAGSVFCSALVRQPVGRHQAHGTAELLKLPCPFVSPGAGLHADEVEAMSRAAWLRGKLWRNGVDLPVASTRWTVNTFLARSTPMVTMLWTCPSNQWRLPHERTEELHEVLKN